MAKGKKAQKNRKRQVAAKTQPADTVITRRNVMALAVSVAGGEIGKYLGPTPTVAIAPATKPLPATSIAFLWGKTFTPVQDSDGDSRIAQGSGTVAVG